MAKKMYSFATREEQLLHHRYYLNRLEVRIEKDLYEFFRSRYSESGNSPLEQALRSLRTVVVQARAEIKKELLND